MIHDRRNTFGRYLEDFASGGTTAPLMIIGEDTNEIQQLLIARPASGDVRAIVL